MYKYDKRGASTDGDFLRWKRDSKPRGSDYYNLISNTDELSKIQIMPDSIIKKSIKKAKLVLRRPLAV